MEETTTINYIFFLQTKNELDNNYVMLSEILSKLNICLLPITPEELKILDKNTKSFLIILRNDLSSSMAINQIRKTYIDVALMSGKLFIYDLSSFSEFELNSMAESKGTYRHIPLPANLKQIAMSVAVDFFKAKNNEEEWPGGRRSKLPTADTQN